MDRIGQQLGNYRLTRLLGQGGFADVYLGEHVHLGIQAAIKVLQGRLSVQDLQDFTKEARTIAGLKHPHVLRVLDFGIEGTTPFLVMDYAPKGTLRDRHSGGTPLPVATILPYVKQVAAALQYAHDQRLVHRDVKPENMLVDVNDTILLSDFGIAIAAHKTQSLSTQDAIGTVTYMAPEQIKGKARLASDQYSLAVVVYEWLCGSVPFDGTTSIEIAMSHLTDPPPSLLGKVPTISTAVEQVVFQALAKDPQQRFPTITDFSESLARVAQPAKPVVVAVPHPPIPASLPPTLSVAQPPTPTPVPPTQSVTMPNAPQKPVSPPQPVTPKQSAQPQQAQQVASPKQVVLPPLQTPAKRGISRRAVIASLAGLGLAVAGGGSIWWAAEHEMPSKRTLEIYRGHSQPVTDVQWSPDGKYIASGSYDNTTQVFDAANNLITKFNGIKSGGAWDGILSVAWSPDGSKIASTSTVGIVQVWEAATGKQLSSYDDNNNDVVTFVAWSPDGKYIASGDADVQLWTVATGKLMTKFRGNFGGVNSVSWSPDGSKIAFGGGEAGQGDEVQVWDINTGNLITKYTGHSDQVSCVSWSPNGNNIASSSYDNTVQVWAAATGKLITKYTGHSDKVSSIAWSPDGTKIASGSGDDTVQVWEAATGKLVIDYLVHTGLTGFLSFAHFIAKGINSVAWSPDGTKIASGLEDDTVQVWQAQ